MVPSWGKWKRRFLFPSEGWSLISCVAMIGKAEARTGSLLHGDARWQASLRTDWCWTAHWSGLWLSIKGAFYGTTSSVKLCVDGGTSVSAREHATEREHAVFLGGAQWDTAGHRNKKWSIIKWIKIYCNTHYALITECRSAWVPAVAAEVALSILFVFIHVDYQLSQGVSVHSRSLSVWPYVCLSPLLLVVFCYLSDPEVPCGPHRPQTDIILLTSSQLHRVHYLNQFKSQAYCWNWFHRTISTVFSLSFNLLVSMHNNILTVLMLSHIRWGILWLCAAASGSASVHRFNSCTFKLSSFCKHGG